VSTRLDPSTQVGAERTRSRFSDIAYSSSPAARNASPRSR
jgi:hypothetical protein